ncbi:MAG TPA: hypothetical protein VMW27_26805, partial [Thermoanaerobaculia bacterium]|nr:hypothetical protein [Thermoanaerobaculia bacterium]
MPERPGMGGGPAGAPVPEFVAQEHELSCGYAPRAMEYSLRSDALFIGCKDGTITIVEKLAGSALSNGDLAQTLRYSRISAWDMLRKNRGLAVRKVCEWSADWLLVARDDGRIDLMNWRQACEESCDTPTLICLWEGSGDDGTAYETNPVTYMDWLDRSRLVVSFRNSGTRIVECRQVVPGTPVEEAACQAFAEQGPEPLHQVTGLCCSVPIEPGRRWLWLAENGTVWVAQDTPMGIELESPERVWAGGEMPGFVTDFAVIKPPDVDGRREGQDDFDYRDQESLGAYVSTDNGVYLLSWDKEGRPWARRVSLPGVGRMCMAITYYASQAGAFLWVSDSAGDAHLFWDHGPHEEDGPNWRRSGIRHDASQVMLAYSSWRTLAGHFVIGQARRNDRVVISLYKVLLGGESAPLPTSTADLPLRSLLRHGTVDDLRRRLEKEDPGVRDWRPDALLAELFEQLGESPEEMKTLREFLGNPNAELARKVLRSLPGREPEPDQLGQAVELWTHALLGTIHRYGQGDGESLYLSVVRWLRAIAEACPEETSQAGRIRRAVEKQIMFARKWGVFGASYAIRSSAAESLRILTEQQQKARDLDHFAYRSLLFQRQVDLELTDDHGQRLGRTAWDLQTLRVGERVLLAVSWIWGDIELYEVVLPSTRAEGEGYRLDLCVVFSPEAGEEGYRLRARNLQSRDTAPRNEPRDYGHSRALVLGSFPEGGYYLLASPAQRPEAGAAHAFELWPLSLDTDRVEATTSEALVRCALRPIGDGQESVYSLLELESGWVVAGLRGHGGVAQVTLVEVSGGEAPTLRCVKPKEKLFAASPEGKAIARNRVWCLVQDKEASSAACHPVYAGCEDGQVWRLEVPRRAPRLEDDTSLQPALVGRLGAPVWALACRTCRHEETGVRRIFVGGADGTIAAWQQLPSDAKFTTVWATWEQGSPIAQLHVLELPTRTPGGASYPSVLAVTQLGRGILFADRAQVQETGSRAKHQRLRVPGERYARFDLRAAVFASALLDLPGRLISASREKAFARLAVATNDGRLQVHTLHYPRYLPERREEYERLVEIWLGLVCQDRDEDTGLFGPFRSQRLRMAEAAYIASPVAPQVLVRGILRDEEPKEDKDDEPARHWDAAPRLQVSDRQWLPRHLRPLLDLDQAWDRLDAKEVEGALDQALERVFRVRDNSLFVEIVSVVLDRANRWLFEKVEPVEGNPPVADVRQVYQAVLRSLERGL